MLEEVGSEAATVPQTAARESLPRAATQAMGTLDESTPDHMRKQRQAMAGDALHTAADLPPDLLGCIAEYLAPRELYAAALVCGHWRASLLDMPLLWTRVCVVQRGSGRGTSVSGCFAAHVLPALFRRSQGLPLDIEFSCDVVESLEEYNAVSAAIKSEMRRARSLSLVLPAVKGAVLHILRSPAPILETFRLHSAASQMTRLPLDLFARNAPRLARVSLSGMILPFHHADTGCVALQAVTELVHDPCTIDNSDLDAIDLHFPSLRSLTLLGDTCDIVTGLGECSRPIHLRLPNIYGISGVLEIFSNTASNCLSSSRGYWDPEALETLAATLHDITSVALCYRPKRHWDSAEYTQHESCDMIAVSVNGMDAAVDLSLHEARRLIDLLSDRLSDVQSVSAHEPLWRDLALHDLPPLAELTLHLSYYAELDDEDDAYSAPWRWYAMYLVNEAHGSLRKHETALLRLVAPRGSKLLDLQESVIIEAILALCEPHALRTLVLCGIGLDVQFPADHPRSVYSLVPGLDVRYEAQGAEDPVEPWCWTMPVNDAVHVQWS